MTEPKGGADGDAARRLARLPPGRHGLPREFVSENQRGRIAAGVIAAVAENGYNEATISRIAAAAGVSRRTFYTYFSSKEECFLDTYNLIAAHIRKAVGVAAAAHQEWPDRVRASLAAILDVFAANPDLARFVLIAPPRAGEEIAERYRRGLDEALATFHADLPADLADRRPSRAAEHTFVGGGMALIARKVEAGEGEQLPEILPDLLELALTPYLGRAEATRIAREPS